MKALVCGRCVDIRALPQDTSWISCRCGTVQARWTDPHRGTAEFRSLDREAARLLGLNNQVLIPAMTMTMRDWSGFRDLHKLATDAPNHIFDKERAGCWAVIVRVGSTNDVTWAPDVWNGEAWIQPSEKSSEPDAVPDAGSGDPLAP